MRLSRLPLVVGVLLSIFILQEAFINRIDFYLGGFSLYLVFVIAWVINEEPENAMLIGFFAGLIADLSPTLEAPFGLWTFVLTGFCYLLVTTIRGNLEPQISPIQMSLVTSISATFLLIIFIIFGAILGQEVASVIVLIKEIAGNLLWSLALAPIYIPMTLKIHKISLTARER
jgi:rod shape-determining protein MreD